MTSERLPAEKSAIDEMVSTYIQTFGDEPDNVTGMVILASVQRVIDGEPFRWVQDGCWRKIEWNWLGFE